MFKVPLIAFTLVFGFAEKLTVPLPLPFAPPVTLIHAAPLTAVQVQPAGAVTLTLSGPPFGPKEMDVADSVGVQATPASVTVKVLPAIVSVPLWLMLLLFALTE
jgi:hypothetical protein